MKRFFMMAMLIVLCFVGAQAQTQPQTQPQERTVTEGPVWRVSYFKIKPGKNADHMKWLREYRMKILNEWKSAGLILDYKFFNKPVLDGPTDWDMMEAVQYKNYGDHLDYSEARSKKVDEIGQKIFGSVENRNKIWADLRDASREVVATQIIREMQIKPMN
ncbi:MAG: hypothetical protein M3367_08745 [Acidobacteriota bacterium]|nr:hypothetical protein [Acidobacteriota bacterium]